MELRLPPKVTDSAFDKIAKIGTTNCLRVAVDGGGCSGFQYDIKLEETILKDDLILEKNGIKVVIDPTSLEFLHGAVIDFKHEIIGSRFVVENPNVTSSCGCGTSFSI